MKKLTLDDINRCIKKADYHRFPGTNVTVCCLTTLHDFHVIGQSACLRDEDFNEATGNSVAHADAVRQIWALEGYLTKYKFAKGEDPVFAISAINDAAKILAPDPEPPAPPPPPPSPLNYEIARKGATFRTPSGLIVPLNKDEDPPEA